MCAWAYGAVPVAMSAQQSPPPPDTVLWVIPDLRGPPPSLPSPVARPVPVVRLGLANVPVTRYGIVLTRPGPTLGPILVGVAAGPAAVALSPPTTPDWATNPLMRFGALGRTYGYADMPEGGLRAGGAGRAFDSVRFRNEFADLGFRISGTGQLGSDWTRYQPCDEAVQVTCEVSLLPQLTPDIRFAADADGTVAGRVQVDVDYDQRREFQSANRVNVRYQGLDGEFLQRFDVGDVDFSLPPSRFLGDAVPAGNFGFQAALQAGPLDIGTVWAQRNGEVTSRRFRLEGSGRGYARADTLVLDDADYVEGQFFFLFDPAAFFEYPHVDALALSRADAPQTVTPGAEPIQLYRSEIDLYARQQVEGHIQADAFAGVGTDSVAESAWFRYLQPGQDYVVHPSGLWIALRSPLSEGELLAVTYVTESGDTIGTYNPERVYLEGGRPRLKLLKATSAQHQPGRPTWRHEMRQVYRVSSSGDVDPASVNLTISLGEQSAGRTFARRPNGDDLTYLRLFGLDEEAPTDEVDPSQIYRPALDSFEDQPPVSGTFIVFPTLEPFSLPAPLRSLPIDSVEARRMLGANRNERIYRDPDPFERENGGVFRLNLSYEVRGEGLASSFVLGAVGIRPGTERVTLEGRPLLREIDYVIDYDIGQLTLVDLNGLLAANPGRFLEVSWEQGSLFQIAPSSVFGMNARYDLGDYGGVNLVGLYQTEDELVRRPQLGVEAGAVGLGGLNANLDLDAPLLTRVLNAIPGLNPGEAPSSIHFSGEAAVSLPNPNTQGEVYIDDYDALNARRLSVQSWDWRRGSRPASGVGADDVLPPEFSPAATAALTWQHAWIREGVGGDSLAVFQGFNPVAEIDQQIRVTGSALRDPALFVRFRPESGDVAGPAAWSSITTVLSPTGTDLTKSDFIEFYARDGEFLTLVLDLGIVSEDAFFVDATGAVNGVKPIAHVPWGQGVLDQEADPRRGEVWGATADARGVWAEECFAERARVYRLGDPNANCTRGNGRPDSEDLDEDGNLDTLERYRRFVIRLDGTSRYLARDRDETGTAFRLYRVPIRAASGIDVGGAITDAELRAVRHLRITVAGRRSDSFVITRMGIVGSTWIKRAPAGVLTGLGGDTASVQGRVEVGPVSRLTEGDAYASPPGVIEQLDDPTAVFGGQGIEFNERSLAIGFEDVLPGDRVEVYNRFPQRPRDFLSYQEARLWAVAARGDFGAHLPVWFFVKIGTDDRNFYMYRTRLDPADVAGQVGEGDWLPEVVIDFEPWLRLRREAEERLVLEPGLARDAPLVLWSSDSTYSVVMQDRGRAPNLASVREISLGVTNGSHMPITGEVWVDELRLSRGIRDAGLASVIDAELRGGEFLQSRATFRSRGGYFRQLRATPTFQDDRALDVQTTLHLDRLTPERWRLEIPLSVGYQRENQSPIFLGRSDVRADRLAGLREPGFARTRIDFSLRRRAPDAAGFWSAFLDGFDLRGGMVRSSLSTVTTSSEGDAVSAFVGYGIQPPRRDFAIFPGPVASLLRAILPSFLEDRVAGARLRWTPESVSLDGELLRRDLDILRFDRIVRTPEDTLVTATEAPRRQVTGSARVTFRPVESLSAQADFLSGRDFLDVERLAADPATRALLETERRRWGGMDLGWETDRHLRTRLGYQPRLSEWARTSVSISTIYLSHRNADLVETRNTPTDTARALLRNVDGQRNLTASFSLDPTRMGEQGTEEESRQWWRRAFDPVSLTWSSGLTSRFNRQAVNPGARYELGWGTREDFLMIGSDSASTLSERDRINVRGGIRLPGFASFRIAYDESFNEALDTRSDREGRRRIWPDFGAAVTEVPIPGFLAGALVRLSFSSGYRREERSLAFGSGTLQERHREDREVPMALTLGFARGLTLSYQGRINRGDSRDPTGDTRRQANIHSLAASARFASPIAAFRRRGAPLRVALTVRYLDEVQCRVTSVGGGCVTFIDQLERDASLSVDAAVQDFQLGVRLRYLDRRSFVGIRPGSTQFQLNVFGRFLLTSALLSQGTNR